MERKRTWLRSSHQNEEERRLNLRERKRIKYITDGVAHDEDEKQESEEEETVKHNYMTSGLPVICGTKLGLLDVKKLEGGEPCIKCEGHLLTPPAFESFSGKKQTKKWKASIFYNKKPLKFWFEKGYLITKGYNRGNKALKKKTALPLSSRPKELSNGESDTESSEDTDEDDVGDDDWLSSSEDQSSESEENEEERSESGEEEEEEEGVNKEHAMNKGENANLEILDTDNEDASDISDYPDDENVVKEENARLITSTPSLQKEAKVIITRLPVTESDWQNNSMELLLEESSNKSLDEDDHNEDSTDDSSITLDDLFFTSVMKNQLPQMAGEARTGGGGEGEEEQEQEELKKSNERQNGQSEIKIETPSYEVELEVNGELKMWCGEKEMRKKEHLDMSISQYNSQPPAAEDGDPTARSKPEQLLITETPFQPTPSPVSKPLCVLVHQNHTHTTEQLQGITSNIYAPQTSLVPDVVEASSAASPGSDEETRDLHQLKREKIKMQLRVLKLQEEYYSLKLSRLKKMKN